MKIEQVIVHHLYNNKEITLQGIGTFRLDPSVPLPADSEKENVIPHNAISFEYNPKATEDISLIDAIVQHTKKIKPLASADLDSFLMLGRQFLNIGKPFTIEGLGTLDKTMSGKLEFIPGEFITPKIAVTKTMREDVNDESSGLFTNYDDKPDNNNGKKALAIILVIFALGIVSWVAYHFLFKKKAANEEKTATQTEQTSVAKDTSLIKKDTAIKKDALQKTSEVISNTSANNVEGDYTFRAVFKVTTNKEAALRSLDKLKSWNHEVVMYTTDSITYKLAELIKLPLSDTTKVKDSLKKFYGGDVFIELPPIH